MCVYKTAEFVHSARYIPNVPMVNASMSNQDLKLGNVQKCFWGIQLGVGMSSIRVTSRYIRVRYILLSHVSKCIVGHN